MLNLNNGGITWIGEEVECYHKGLDDGMSTFYKAFSYNGVNYQVDDMILFKTALSTKLGKLLCVYESSANWHEQAKFRGVVKWFTKAADLPKIYTADINYDPDNEVVEDLRNTDTNVSLQDAAQKCTLIYAHLDDPVYLIDDMKLDPESYFSCRYRIKRNKLIPILSSISTNDLLQLNSNESTPKTYKKKTNNENKQNSNSIKKCPRKSVSIVLTPNRAKRNLNESFDTAKSPVLNYSIVENVVDSDKPIRIKLKLSDVKKLEPCVLLDRVEGELLEKKIESCVSEGENLFTKQPKDVIGRLNDKCIEEIMKKKCEEDELLKSTNNNESKLTDNKSDDVHEETSVEHNKKIKNLVNEEDDSSEYNKNNCFYASSEDGFVKILDTNEVLNVSVDEVPLKDRLRIIQDEEETTVRRSTRAKNRKSYADFISPVKTTPRKSRLRSTENDTPSKKKNVKIQEPALRTPSKRTRSTSQEIDPSPSKRQPGRPKRNAGKPVKYQDDFLDLIIDENSPDFKSKKHRNVSELIEEENEVVKRVSPLKIQRTPGRNKLYHIAEDSASPSLRTRSRKLSEDDSNINTPTKRKQTNDLNVRTPSRRQLMENVKTPSKKDSNQEEENVVPSPRKTRERKFSEDSEASLPSPRKRAYKVHKDTYTTPKKGIREVIAKTPKNTPSAKMKLIREGVITPSMQCRKTAVVSQGTPLNKAREKLHVSYVPDALPCREREFADVLSFVQGKLLDGCGGCMYVSGVPGTGKTATVTEVIRNLQETAKNGDIPDFNFVSINGMRLTEPRQSYVEILKQLTGKTVAWEQAQSMLDTRFTKASKKGKSQAIVMLVDELDILCTKRQDVVYNLLDWPTKATAQLIVITIANTMDLPERLLMGRVTSRLGLTRLTFQAYTHKQLQEIVMRRLLGTNAFNPDAIQLVARKVASVSGDARRALDICRRAAEIAEAEGPQTLVSMGHVNEALNAMITQPKVRAIKRCSRLEQLILQAVVAEVERTGVDETTFADVYTMLSSVAGIDGFPMVSVTLALAAVSRLGSSRLLLTDQKANDIHQRLILNVSPDDIYYALRKD